MEIVEDTWHPGLFQVHAGTDAERECHLRGKGAATHARFYGYLEGLLLRSIEWMQEGRLKTIDLGLPVNAYRLHEATKPVGTALVALPVGPHSDVVLTFDNRGGATVSFRVGVTFAGGRGGPIFPSGTVLGGVGG